MSYSSEAPDPKKPCKGILKSSSSFDKHSAASLNHRKSAKFDELNVLQTYHPPDKDYGHMKVDEPKTPYNFVEDGDVDQLDAELLAEKLRVAATSRGESVSEEDEESEEEEELSEEQKKRKVEFERRRKAHYNEFEAVKLARKLIEEDEDDEEENDDVKVEGKGRSAAGAQSNSSGGGSIAQAAGSSSSAAAADPGASHGDTHMETEECEVDLNPRPVGGSTATPQKIFSSDSQTRLKPVLSAPMLVVDSSERRATHSGAISLIMIVAMVLMGLSIVGCTLLFYFL